MIKKISKVFFYTFPDYKYTVSKITTSETETNVDDKKESKMLKNIGLVFSIIFSIIMTVIWENNMLCSISIFVSTPLQCTPLHSYYFHTTTKPKLSLTICYNDLINGL